MTIYTLRKILKKYLPFNVYRFFRLFKQIVFRFHLFLIRLFITNRKWKLDTAKSNHLVQDHKKLYFLIQSYYYKKFKKFADIINPTDYNEKIQWLKLFDQDTRMISCTDKYAVREYVKKTVGEKYLNILYGVYNDFNEIDVNTLPKSFVIKTNHDSGTVFLIKDKQKADWKRIKNRIKDSLSHTYGMLNGEWSYTFIPKNIIIERYHQPESDTLPPDYKFHCVYGKVQWLQYIFDRGFNTTKEIHFDRNFNKIPLHLDSDFPLSKKDIKKPSNWDELLTVAEKLTASFKYARVDLYNIEEIVYFGELTFFPKGGYYTSTDQKKFGELMNFDITTVKKPIINNMVRS